MSEHQDAPTPKELEAKRAIPPVFLDSERNYENILFHATRGYDAEQGGLDPKKSQGEGSVIYGLEIVVLTVPVEIEFWQLTKRSLIPNTCTKILGVIGNMTK